MSGIDSNGSNPDVREALGCLAKLSRRDRNVFIKGFARTLNAHDIHLLNQEIDPDTTKKDIIACLPQELVIHVTSFLDIREIYASNSDGYPNPNDDPRNDPLIYVSKSWYRALTNPSVSFALTKPWFENCRTRLLCEDRQESQDVIAKKRMETMLRFCLGKPKSVLRLAKPIHAPVYEGGMLAALDGEDDRFITIVNLKTGQRSRHCRSDRSRFFSLHLSDQYLFAYSQDAGILAIDLATREKREARLPSSMVRQRTCDGPLNIFDMYPQPSGDDRQQPPSKNLTLLIWDARDGRLSELKISLPDPPFEPPASAPVRRTGRNSTSEPKLSLGPAQDQRVFLDFAASIITVYSAHRLEGLPSSKERNFAFLHILHFTNDRPGNFVVTAQECVRVTFQTELEKWDHLRDRHLMQVEKIRYDNKYAQSLAPCLYTNWIAPVRMRQHNGTLYADPQLLVDSSTNWNCEWQGVVYQTKNDVFRTFSSISPPRSSDDLMPRISRQSNDPKNRTFIIDCAGNTKAGDACFLIVESNDDPLMVLSFDPDVVYSEREAREYKWVCC